MLFVKLRIHYDKDTLFTKSRYAITKYELMRDVCVSQQMCRYPNFVFNYRIKMLNV